MQYRAAVIGLGNIGYAYDAHLSDRYVLTHSRAFFQHPGFELCAGVDPDPNKRAEFSARYGVAAYAELAEINRLALDVVAICTPTKSHYHHFSQVLELRPKLILCEKPLSDDYAEAEHMVSLAEEKGITLGVNYMRRFDPCVNSLKKSIENQKFGSFLSGIVWFKRGVINNASHFVDLLIYLFGFPSGYSLIVHSAQTESIQNFHLQWGNASVFFCAVDMAEFNYFEMELVGSKQRISYCDSGEHIYSRNLSSSADMSQQHTLAPAELVAGGDFRRYQYHVQQGVFEHLKYGRALPSTGKTALASLKIVCDLEKQFSKGEFV